MTSPPCGPGTPDGGGAMTPVMPVSDSDGSGDARPALIRSAGTPVGRNPTSAVCTSISSAPKLGPAPPSPIASWPRTARRRSMNFTPGRSSPSNEPTATDRCLSSSRASSFASSMTMSGSLAALAPAEAPPPLSAAGLSALSATASASLAPSSCRRAGRR